MRNLANFVVEFKTNVTSSHSLDMLYRNNWGVLKEAIITSTTKDVSEGRFVEEGTLKYGMKNTY